LVYQSDECAGPSGNALSLNCVTVPVPAAFTALAVLSGTFRQTGAQTHWSPAGRRHPSRSDPDGFPVQLNGPGYVRDMRVSDAPCATACEAYTGVWFYFLRRNMGIARLNRWLFLVALSLTCSAVAAAQTNGGATTSTAAMGGSRQAAMDRDLLEVTIPKLEKMYAAHKYTVTQVVQWHLARIAKYNGIYRAVQTVDAKGALATAAEEDAAAKKGGDFQRGPMWGVPIVLKSQYQRQRANYDRRMAWLSHPRP